MEPVVKKFSELTLEELYEILSLRADVFVVEQKSLFRDIDGKDQEAYHVFIRDGGGIGAYLRVLAPGASFAEASIGRVVTRKRRCGLGARVMSAGLETVRERFGDVPVRIEAQTYARGFYESFGFRQASDEFLDDGIPHIEMLLER